MSTIIEVREPYVEDVVILAGTPNEYVNHYRHARETDVKCDCGRVVTCSAREFTVTCECGRDYNGNGSLLNPRWMWGEETGEWFGNAPSEEW